MIRAALLVLIWPALAWAGPVCEDLGFEGLSFTICAVDPAQERLELFLQRADGGPHGSFQSINKELSARGEQLSFAMNAGMYHADRRPVGYFLQNGTTVQRLITSAGPGNFGLLPNGVLCLRKGRADVIETLRFEREVPTCDHATQSGPMLVIDGALHPRFLPDSTSRYIRNGVGTSADGGRVVFAISNQRVTFHEFGRFFRDALKLPQALYFDGNISRLHAPALKRSDGGFAMGPIIGTVASAD